MFKLVYMYKNYILIVVLLSVLIFCYSQQKELDKLRASNIKNQYITDSLILERNEFNKLNVENSDIKKVIDSLTLIINQKDSLCNKYEWATNLYFVELHSDLTEFGKFKRIFNEDYRQLEREANGGY
jgi:hypothetical protein